MRESKNPPSGKTEGFSVNLAGDAQSHTAAPDTLSPLAATCFEQGCSPETIDLISRAFTEAAAEMRRFLDRETGHA